MNTTFAVLHVDSDRVIVVNLFGTAKSYVVMPIVMTESYVDDVTGYFIETQVAV